MCVDAQPRTRCRVNFTWSSILFAYYFVPPHAYGRIAIYQGFIAIASVAEYIERNGRPVGDALLYIAYRKLPGVQDNKCLPVRAAKTCCLYSAGLFCFVY